MWHRRNRNGAVLIEKLIVTKLVKSVLYGTQMFIAVFVRARHMTVS
jgi:hypothetical protein